MYEVYNRDPKVIGEYTESEHAKKALKNMRLAAVVVKDGKVLAYKQSLSIREQARIRDAIAEEYEGKQNREDPEDDESEQDFKDIEDAGEPAVEQHPVVSSPGQTVSGSIDRPPVQPVESRPEPEPAPTPPAEVSQETVAKVMPPECKTEYCGRPALRITEHTRPEHHGLCKRCRDRAYERARSKPKSPTKNAALPPPSDIAEHIGSLILQAIGNQLTGEQREILQLGEIIGLETLRVLAARVQK